MKHRKINDAKVRNNRIFQEDEGMFYERQNEQISWKERYLKSKKLKSSGHESRKPAAIPHNKNESTQLRRKYEKKLEMCRNSWWLKRSCTKQSRNETTDLQQKSTECRICGGESLEVYGVQCQDF